jgi:hypothetical protein
MTLRLYRKPASYPQVVHWRENRLSGLSAGLMLALSACAFSVRMEERFSSKHTDDHDTEAGP